MAPLSKAHVCTQGICIKTPFLLVGNLNREVILGTPFLNLLQPMTVSSKEILSIINDQEIIFEFLNPPNIKDLNHLKSLPIYLKEQINSIVKIISKKKLNLLKDETIIQNIQSELLNKNM